LASYVRALNDTTHDARRQELLPYLPRLIGTAEIANERQRVDRLVLLVASQGMGAADAECLR
jgi:hypothetical protein